jgi:chromosome segregation ATPase
MSERDVTERMAISPTEATAYRSRREALHAATTDLDRDLGEIAGHEQSQLERYRDALQRTIATLERHVEEADAPAGLLAQIMDAAPWLSPRAQRLRAEHNDLLDRARDLLARADEGHDLTSLVLEARSLSAQISEHRHHGTTLLQDAYALDLAAGD